MRDLSSHGLHKAPLLTAIVLLALNLARLGILLALEVLLALRVKAGGGGRTRTFEAMRRLIYSQLPLPLGTLPRIDAHRNPRVARTCDDGSAIKT